MKSKIITISLLILSCIATSAQTKPVASPKQKPSVTNSVTKPKHKKKPAIIPGQTGTFSNKPSNNQSNNNVRKSQSREKLTKRTVYKFDPGEYISEGEFFSNFKSNNTNFVFVTENDDTNEMSLVINGKREATADFIESPYTNFSNSNPVHWCRYQKGNDIYIYRNGKSYGPYESVRLSDPIVGSIFFFKRMGKYYKLQVDGSIVPIDEDEFYNNWEISFSDDYRYATINGNRYKIPLNENHRDYGGSNIYRDSGFITFNFRPKDESILDNNYFMWDPVGGLKKITAKQFNYLGTLTSEGEMEDDLFDTDYDEDTEEGGYNIEIFDPSRRHLFNSAWNKDYVIIDDNKIECSPPFYAFFDEKDNSFTWVSQEDRELVIYTYRL